MQKLRTRTKVFQPDGRTVAYFADRDAATRLLRAGRVDALGNDQRIYAIRLRAPYVPALPGYDDAVNHMENAVNTLRNMKGSVTNPYAMIAPSPDRDTFGWVHALKMRDRQRGAGMVNVVDHVVLGPVYTCAPAPTA